MSLDRKEEFDENCKFWPTEPGLEVLAQKRAHRARP